MGIVGRKNLDSRGEKNGPRRIEAAMEQPRRFLTHGARKIAVRGESGPGRKDAPRVVRPLASSSQSGELLDDFKIEQEIATGATATVYEAWQVSAQRVAAFESAVAPPRHGPDGRRALQS
jgi:hypothetical protein